MHGSLYMAPRVNLNLTKQGNESARRGSGSASERESAGRGQRPRSIGRSGAGEKVSDSEGSGRGGGETILSLPPVYRLSESARVST